MAQNSGFFDSLIVDGSPDRLYSSADYCDNLATIIKNGVRYSSDNDLKVTAGSGMTLGVGIGRAWINGHYFYNDTAASVTVGTAPTGSNKRIDRVVLRLDTSISTRRIYLAVKQGTAAASPTAPALTRAGEIYELALADILVEAGVTQIAANKITDQRANGAVCGWAASVTPAIMSMLQKYEWKKELTSATSTVEFVLAQYDPADVHILEVYTNGILETLGTDYTIAGNTITFSSARNAGNEIKVILYKSIDGTGLESVAQKVAELEQRVATVTTANEYIYICNGVNDNIKLSELADDWLSGGTDYSSKIIRVYGTFGASSAYSGNGSEVSPFNWIRAGSNTPTNRKLVFDFSGCSQINISCADNSFNTIFYGINVHIIGANVIATGAADITMFSRAAATVVRADDCRFWITANTGYIARGGTFRDCRVSLTLNAGDAFCFNTLAGGVLRLFGGEHYAYAATGNSSAVVYVNAAQIGATVATYGINCPTVARGGYVQAFAINCLTADAGCSFTDTITTLPITASAQNIRGTIQRSKPGLM